MGLKCGIIGVSGSGKTTLFNSLTNQNLGVNHTGYDSHQVHLGTAYVIDPRLDFLHSIIYAQRKVYATIEFADIPGIPKEPSRSGSKAPSFPPEIRQVDALIYVLRCFENLLVGDQIDPLAEKEFLSLELQVKDLEQIEKKLEKVEKRLRAGDKQLQKTYESLIKMRQALQNFQNIRDLALDDADIELVKELQPLTAKPVIYVLNVDEDYQVSLEKYSYIVQKLESENVQVLSISAKLEYEISQFQEEAEREMFMKELGIDEPGMNKLSRAAYAALNYISFFTVGGKENRAWTIRKGTTAYEAAGVIHSDIQRGFIRAEVISFEDMQALKSEQACKEKGKLRLEGKNYVVQDGDIIHIRFNV